MRLFGAQNIDEERASVVCTSAAHLDPEHAIINALREFAPIASSLDRSIVNRSDYVKSLVADSSNVEAMSDHSMLYSSPVAAERLNFLSESSDTRTIEEIQKSSIPISPDNLTEDLDGTVDRFRKNGLDVLVVDQTTSEHDAAGLHCVKVVVPGCLPMTFGHSMRRIEDLPRVYSVPAALGDKNPPREKGDLNGFPHPFP